MTHNPDPIRYYDLPIPCDDWKGEGWYFWNEVWIDLYGPFETEEEARAELEKYCIANGL